MKTRRRRKNNQISESDQNSFKLTLSLLVYFYRKHNQLSICINFSSTKSMEPQSKAMRMPTSLDTPHIIETPTLQLQESLASSTTGDFWSPLIIPEQKSKDDSSDMKSNIAQELEESVIKQCREPTDSIFFPRNKSTVDMVSKTTMNMNPVNNSNEPLAAPTTADVLSDLMTLDTKDSVSEPYPSTPSTPNVPLKKRVVVNQPVTEVSTFPVQSQAVPNDLYGRNNELGVVKQEIDSSTEFNPSFHLTLQYQPVIDTQRAPVTLVNSKRTFHNAFIGTVPLNNNLSAGVMSSSLANEVTSSGQIQVKRRSTGSQNSTNAKHVHENHSASRSMRANSQANVDQDPNSEDSRRQQIRDSNREAARRCRERRRNYIEQLESDLDKQKLEIQRLTDKLLMVERENIQLKTILKEANIATIRRYPN